MQSIGSLVVPAAAGAVLAAVLGACGGSDDDATGAAPGGADGDGGLPDVCTLLSEAEVQELTGRTVDQVDEDGLDAASPTRHCQWQGADLRLAVFLARTTLEAFTEESGYDGASPVDGLGEAAYTNGGHLFVLDGTVQMDVYTTSADTDEQNAIDAAEVAQALLPKVG